MEFLEIIFLFFPYLKSHMPYKTMAFYNAFVLYFLVIQRIIKLLTVSAVSNSTKYTRLHNRIQKNFRGIAFYEHLSI